MTITISTDGSALGNPNGPMGWAWADHAKNAGGTEGHHHDERGYDHGGATNGTNQIGELCAVLEALRAHPGAEPLLIESDSQYAINCSTKWVKGWKRNGWRNSQKKPVKNVELIKAIDAEIAKREGPVDFRWVKGHAGNVGNELVDELARGYATDCRSGAKDGYLPIEGWQSLLHSDYAEGTDVPPDVQLVLEGKASADSLRPQYAVDEATGDDKPATTAETTAEHRVKQPVKQSEQRDDAVLPPSDELFGRTQHTNVDNAATATSVSRPLAIPPSGSRRSLLRPACLRRPGLLPRSEDQPLFHWRTDAYSRLPRSGRICGRRRQPAPRQCAIHQTVAPHTTIGRAYRRHHGAVGWNQLLAMTLHSAHTTRRRHG